MHYRVGTNGQVVIAKKLRDQLGIKPGWFATQMVVDDHVEMYFAPPSHRRSLKGSLREYAVQAGIHAGSGLGRGPGLLRGPRQCVTDAFPRPVSPWQPISTRRRQPPRRHYLLGRSASSRPGTCSTPAWASIEEPWKSLPTGSKRPPRCSARNASVTALNEMLFSGLPKPCPSSGYRR